VSILNRFIIINSVIYFWDAETLGEIGNLIAFNALSTFGGSIIYLNICKGAEYKNIFTCIIIICNILSVTILHLTSFPSNFQIIFFIILIQILINFNLIFSGLYFYKNFFFKYRIMCIKSEIAEIIFFFTLLLISKDPVLSVLGSLFIKNSCLILLSLLNYSLILNVKNQVKQKVTSLTSVLDVTGSQMVAGFFPLIISYNFGTQSLGSFIFIRQFFALGNTFQAAVFKGIWRDSINNTEIIKLLPYVERINIALPALMIIPVLFLFPLLDKLLIFGVAVTYIFLTWSRAMVQIRGHILSKFVINNEIIFVIIFYLFVSLLSKNIFLSHILLISVFTCLLIYNIGFKYAVYIFKKKN
jgi:hypothetical protein